jgi:hypothetical protein
VHCCVARRKEPWRMGFSHSSVPSVYQLRRCSCYAGLRGTTILLLPMQQHQHHSLRGPTPAAPCGARVWRGAPRCVRHPHVNPSSNSSTDRSSSSTNNTGMQASAAVLRPRNTFAPSTDQHLMHELRVCCTYPCRHGATKAAAAAAAAVAVQPPPAAGARC